MNGVQKRPNLGPDFRRMGFEREVTCVIKAVNLGRFEGDGCCFHRRWIPVAAW
jgi:hypothetical protein